jgi:hypothetical protein
MRIPETQDAATTAIAAAMPTGWKAGYGDPGPKVMVSGCRRAWIAERATSKPEKTTAGSNGAVVPINETTEVTLLVIAVAAGDALTLRDLVLEAATPAFEALTSPPFTTTVNGVRIVSQDYRGGIHDERHRWGLYILVLECRG